MIQNGFCRMRVLNLSNNRLCELPNGCHQTHQLEKLYLTANCLADNSLDVLGKFSNLHTLHAAYNSITRLPESCVAVWTELEELVLSGNKLQNLPDNIIHLKHLRVLRVHSNRLQTIPCFAKMSSLKVLDLAHNCLDRVNLATLVPQQLQFLDLSCNSKLYVDPRQFQVYRTHRPMSLVDVSGQNRTCLPSTPHHEAGADLGPPWKVGFSETAGHRERLYITQIRLPAFCNMEGLFGMFDGGNNNDIPNILTKAVPRMLLEERTVKETASEYMKYTMLSAHRELKETGQKYGVCGTLCHIVRTRPTGSPSSFLPGCHHQYTMRVASVGEARAVLCRRSGLINLSQTTQANPNHSQLGCSAMFPLVIPDPHVTEVDLDETDEFLIIANKRFWEVVSIEEAAQEIQGFRNSILAAKRLQDLAQSYGSEENLSIMVVHFGNLASTDVEQMMRELRHTIQKTKQQCQCNCCCGDGPHRQRYYVQNPPEADRSSPSGQSDHASSDCMGRNRLLEQDRMATLYKNNLMTSTQSVLMHENGTKKMGPAIERRSYRDSRRSNGGVFKAIRSKVDSYSNGHLADAEEETGSDRSGTEVSEEQFKCWEYMLEQNTQLLFDKELDTLSRGFGRRAVPRAGVPLDPLWHEPSVPLKHRVKALSRSSPHLSDSAAMPAVPFLSRHFGSARSFNPIGQTSVRFGSGRHILNGGPNAAYFGSLQRLIPYNLEYNFSVIQERGGNQDSLEQDGRMQQYWGVTTTEL
ncbi:hypothetical protein B7P43_G02364 [Cryptotermes secundus]|uniref:PPM-type phosphatase domain-containing protein n=1 Tax=Cryptotermes secundus TaxID=105785 RepID=A0A2J7RAV6_9NEOP|nr:hypothetical protein B7P43_G02364 [Cryptotermes secundus]